MSRQFIAEVIRESTGVNQLTAHQTANDLIEQIIRALKREGSFQIMGFGTLTVRRTKARKGRNPQTGEAVKIKAGKTVRFKASQTLKHSV